MLIIRKVTRPVVGRAVDWAGANRAVALAIEQIDRIGTWPRGTVAILTYHRVDDPRARPDLFPGLISATPEMFEQQIAYVARRMRVVSIDDLLAARHRAGALPPRAVHLTVDDAYQDFAEHAWPVLRRYGVPVTLFVPTAFPDQPRHTFWWDRLHAAWMATSRRSVVIDGIGPVSVGEDAAGRYRAMIAIRDRVKALEHDAAMALVGRVEAALDAAPAVPAVLGWETLRSLAGEGVALAPHSRTHPLLTRLGADRLGDELAGSRADLERETGSQLPVFAYPSGAHDDDVVRAAGDAGFDIAFSTKRGIWDTLAGDWLQVSRINIGRRTRMAILRAQLTPVAARLTRVTGKGT
jgi:peptidoglycan/xylan/chitin deacetylase (PgdA/CDA1 family)